MDNNFIWQYVFENTDDGVVGISYKGGKIIFANDAAATILEEKELLGKTIMQCIPYNDVNDEINQLIVDAVMDKENSHGGLVSFLNKTDIKRLQVKSYFLEKDNEKLGVILIFNDITEIFRVRSTFTRYLSESIVDQLLDTPEGLRMGGKKTKATVMMSDLRGFSAMSEAMDPASLITMLNHYFEQMVEAIQKYKGTIIEFMGDGIFAVFGAPVDDAEHETHAVAAAIEMQQRIIEVNKWNAKHGYPELMMGVGINTGDLVVGNIGSEKRAKFGVMGSSVNIAGRVESYTTEGQVLISEYTKAGIKTDISFLSSKEVQAKGINHPIEIFEVDELFGDYNLKVPEQVVGKLDIVTNDVAVPMGVVIGKDVQEFCFNAKFIAINEKYAQIEANTKLDIDQNICLMIGDQLYAKVKKIEETSVIVCFTAKPAIYKEWEKCLFL